MASQSTITPPPGKPEVSKEGSAYSPIPTSLDPVETKSHSTGAHIDGGRYRAREDFSFQPIEPGESEFRHSGWAVRRQQTFKALETFAGSNRISNFCNCGSALWLDQSGSDLRMRCNCCHDRFCVPCQVERGRRIAAVLKDHIRDRRVRFVTLTRRHSYAPLRDQIDAVYQAFSALRRRKWWAEHVTGGAAFLEVKLSDRDGLWHPHLHIILEGKFLPQRDLAAEWLAVTMDSSIVDVRDCPPSDHDRVASYVTKYVTKPASSEVFNAQAKLVEMMMAMKGRRLALTFAGWRGLKLNDPPDPEAKIAWVPVGSISNLATKAARGDDEALRFWTAAVRKWPRLALFGGP